MSYTDWTLVLDEMEPKDLTILELGLGEGTKELVKRFDYVYSFETWTNREWYEKTVKEIDVDNWSHYFKPLSYYGLDGINRKKHNQPVKLQKYLDELLNWVDLDKIDVALVDQGFYMRGETVNFFMEHRIPFIIAHDTNKMVKGYGWNLIKNTHYDEKKFTHGEGTTLWRLR